PMSNQYRANCQEHKRSFQGMFGGVCSRKLSPTLPHKPVTMHAPDFFTSSFLIPTSLTLGDLKPLEWTSSKKNREFARENVTAAAFEGQFVIKVWLWLSVCAVSASLSF